MTRSALALLTLAIAVTCTASTPSAAPTAIACPATSIAPYVDAAGDTKWGQRDGDVFFQTGNPPSLPQHRLRASPTLEKILVVLAKPIAPPAPNSLAVNGRERVRGATETVQVTQALTTGIRER